jgi:tetratricopeptide (TPR) repeat protein
VLTGREMPWALALYGGSLASAGRRAEAQELLAELERLSRREYVPPLHLALVHVQLGDTESALASFGMALEERNAFLWGFARSSPVFDPLRMDPRFQRLLAAIRPE